MIITGASPIIRPAHRRATVAERDICTAARMRQNRRERGNE